VTLSITPVPDKSVQQDIVATAVPLPPREEQVIIVEQVEYLLSTVMRAEEAVDAELRRGANLRQAILWAAFSGRLVPQNPHDEPDPHDEPASVLLERIRAERTAKPRPARGRRRGTGAGARQFELLR
jgi:type I restriction enzyme S subunit